MEIWAAVVLIAADLLYGGALVAWLAPPPDAASVEQPWEGACKPPAIDVSGAVSFECRDVAAKALDYMNARLSEILQRQLLGADEPGRPARDLNGRIEDLHRLAEDWTRRYRELQDRLNGSEPARRVRALIQSGEIDAAEAGLQELATTPAPGSPEAAAAQFNLGDAAMLRFDPAAALAHFEKACRIEPDNPLYSSGYAMAAYRARYYAQAQRGWTAALERYRVLAAHDPAAYRPDVAATLTNLGLVNTDLGRPEEARKATAEALTLTRALAVDDPTTYAGLAASLNRRLSDLGAAPPADVR
jgi:tetratricopeptide (TPR) repeat protein